MSAASRRPRAQVVIDMQRDFVEPGGFGESLATLEMIRVQGAIVGWTATSAEVAAALA